MNNNDAYEDLKPLVIVNLIMAALFLIGVADLPYGYYQFLRIATMVLSGISILYAFMIYEKFVNFPCISSLLILILFNPVLPIYMDKESWAVFDVISAALVLVSCAFAYFKAKSKQN